MMDVMIDSQMNGTHKHRENTRQCRHNHGKSKKSVVVQEINSVPSAPSPINEDIEEEDEEQHVDILKLEDRPLSGIVEGKSRPPSSISQRPSSRRPDSRPGSTRSAFEQIPGTRPASRRVIFLYLKHMT